MRVQFEAYGAICLEIRCVIREYVVKLIQNHVYVSMVDFECVILATPDKSLEFHGCWHKYIPTDMNRMASTDLLKF